MGELGALFNPGMRHELEERRAKAARREEEGNARDGDLRIDLESGVAVINIPGADDDETDDATAARPEDSDAGQAGEPAESGTGTDQTAEPQTPAAATMRPRGKRGLSATTR